MPKPAGAFIRSLRQQRGDKVRELAPALRIKRKTAYNIEAGQPASIEVLNRYANYFGVEVSELIAP